MKPYGHLMLRRTALALAAVFVLGALAATFLPASPNGATCGTWIAPEWDRDEAAALVAEYGELFDATDDPALAGEIAGSAEGVTAAVVVCGDALGTRRTVTFVLLGLAVAVPAGVLFVAPGRRQRVEA